MNEPARAELTVDLPPGQALIHLIVQLSRRAGMPVRPRLDGEGTHIVFTRRFLDGEGQVTLTAEGDSGTRVVLVGTPPPWPFRAGWAQRKLSRLVRTWGDGTIAAL